MKTDRNLNIEYIVCLLLNQNRLLLTDYKHSHTYFRFSGKRKIQLRENVFDFQKCIQHEH